MAVFNIKSTVIANRDATPKILTDALVSGGELLESEGYCASGSAADGVGSTYRLCQVPSNARMSSLMLQNDAFGGAAAINVGVYWPSFLPRGAGLDSFSAGAAISANLFAAAKAVVVAGGPSELIGNISIANQELPLWQMAGLASDPGIDLDIVAAVSTIFAAAGSIGAKAKYVKQ
jgi:hypothetical protein